MIWLVRQFLWLYFADLNHHFYHYYRIVKCYFGGFFPQLVYMPLHLIIVDPLNDSTATLLDSSVRSQTFTSLNMESPRITVTSLEFLIFFISSPFYYWFFCCYCYSCLIYLYSVYQVFYHFWVLPCFHVMILSLFWCMIVLVSLWSRRVVANQKHFL